MSIRSPVSSEEVWLTKEDLAILTTGNTKIHNHTLSAQMMHLFVA
jgi:hypothetical protein